jgi:hypothetical protein
VIATTPRSRTLYGTVTQNRYTNMSHKLPRVRHKRRFCMRGQPLLDGSKTNKQGLANGLQMRARGAMRGACEQLWVGGFLVLGRYRQDQAWERSARQLSPAITRLAPTHVSPGLCYVSSFPLTTYLLLSVLVLPLPSPHPQT